MSDKSEAKKNKKGAAKQPPNKKPVERRTFPKKPLLKIVQQEEMIQEAIPLAKNTETSADKNNKSSKITGSNSLKPAFFVSKEEAFPNNNQKKRICLYHQFARCYKSIKEMEDHLDDIKAMGFTHVWISPIQDNEKKSYFTIDQKKFAEWVPNKDLVETSFENASTPQGSLYAMRNSNKFDYFITTKKELTFEKYEKLGSFPDEDIKAIKSYTARCEQLELTPLFDLVINQVSAESFLVAKYPNWFRENNPTNKEPLPFGSGCRHFNYEDPKVRKEIISFWINYINMYVLDFGFKGARIDAVKYIPVEVQKELYEIIYKATKSRYNEPPIIFIEMLLNKRESIEYISKSYEENNLKNFITHITNSLHWRDHLPSERTTREYRSETGDQLGKFNQIAPTVGFAGCHDHLSLHGKIVSNNFVKKYIAKKYNTELSNVESNYRDYIEDFTILSKQQLAVIALASNGGYYFLSGDEFLLPGRRAVWDFHKLKENFKNKWGASNDFDIRDFIYKINMLIQKLPKPTFCDWLDQLVLPDKPNLVVMILHHGEGFENNASLIIINTQNATIKIEENDIEILYKILRGLHSQAQEKAINCLKECISKDKIFVVGSIQIFNNIHLNTIADSYQENICDNKNQLKNKN